jgi:signal transduction histidine kinase/DNA-binding response OmpR family regulator
MLFGPYDGFIIFHPDSVKDDPVPPQVIISNVSLFNRPDDKLEYDGFISDLKELNLTYNENDLRFDYVGLHYSDPSKNQYKYMLENFDDDWIDAGTQRNATYTNLDAGEYIFRVTACNADGVWNKEGASLKIIIPPPFWATWWAYTIYVLFVLVLLYSIRRYELNRTQLKNQHKLDEVKLNEREETDKMKSRFFANISHEFRTPLTLILGPSERIVTDSNQDEIKKKAGTIKRNANRLLSLINQLLDLSKLEAGKLELKASKDNIVPFIKGITMSFESAAEGKDITLKVKSSNDEIDLYFDKEKMTKIMTNLLSNAFKFTPEGGAITVNIKSPTPKSPPGRGLKGVGRVYDGNYIEIKVKDTGVGIPKEELPKLFDRFYQVDSSQTREHEGTGIGLALTKELVELHHGTISADSKLGGWTEFIIELPVGRKHLKDEEIVETEEPIEDEFKVERGDFVPTAVEEVNETQVTDEDKNIVLVVEDNADVREFIKDSLGNEFQIEEASNGEQGVRKAEQIIPDLIISDVMMPKMDGNELTRQLKSDEKTSHIPIILLTAKSEQQSKLEGLETGADDYLTKPFDTKELQIRINNLINIRRKLQEKFSRVDFVPVKKAAEKKLTNLEEQFMSKVMEVLETHLSEEEFSIEQFGKEVGMSRVQLHRKLKALSGKSASNYLRSVRLNKAKKMIEEQKGNISEIAYSVGFSSPQYFSRSFKEEFGFPPSDLVT